MLYKLLISLRCMNESPTVAACVSTGSRRCVYKSFSLSRFILILVDFIFRKKDDIFVLTIVFLS